MFRRTHESPMDYEYDNRTGPGDPSSPFHKLAQNNIQRHGFASPSRPLQDSTTFSFSATPAKAAPFRNPSFTTPRKPFDADLFSETSGAESSPADNGDTEDTPEVLGRKQNTITASKVKQPIFGKYGLGWGNSPGRGDVKRIDRHKDTALQKVKKRKRLDRDHYQVQRRGSMDSDDSSRPGSRNNDKPPPSTETWIGSFFTSLENRPGLPYVLSHYPQILLNYFMFGIVVWLMFIFISSIRLDLAHAQEEAMSEVLHEINKCAMDYTQNKCAPNTRLPAMESVCYAWEVCMNRDPKSVSKSKLTAHAMGQAINSFIEPIGWKALAFISLLFGVALTTSYLLGGQAKATYPHPQQVHMQQPQQPWFASPHPSQDPQWAWGVPQTPSRVFGGGLGEDIGQMRQIMPSGRSSPRKTSRN